MVSLVVDVHVDRMGHQSGIVHTYDWMIRMVQAWFDNRCWMVWLIIAGTYIWMATDCILTPAASMDKVELLDFSINNVPQRWLTSDITGRSGICHQIKNSFKNIIQSENCSHFSSTVQQWEE